MDTARGYRKPTGTHTSDFRAYHPLTDRYRNLGSDFRGPGRSSCTPSYTFGQLVFETFRAHFAGFTANAVVTGGSSSISRSRCALQLPNPAFMYAITYPDKVSHCCCAARLVAPPWVLRRRLYAGTHAVNADEGEALATFEACLGGAPNALIEMLDPSMNSSSG
ncbi:hypothetical protein B0H13DRAFT_2448730 [Mycena leptocephala]|nr:hypothetical protein B0H13DRAFT_2448730 [Mycena leptocephala]